MKPDANATENDFDLPKRCRHCYQRAYRIDSLWIQKVRCRRCPLCNAHILGLGAISEGIANDGTENCSDRRCNYKRQVFSPEEMLRVVW